jgi:2-haloacid dehalogenase
MNRRTLLAGGAGLASMLLNAPLAGAKPKKKFKAIAFDAFPVFDPRPIAALCEELFPKRGTELINLWRTRQFEYSWLRTVSNRYANFEQVTDDALTFAIKSLKLEMTEEQHARLRQAHFKLKTWPDVIPALKRLHEKRTKLAFLSNFTPGMLKGCIETAGLNGMFEKVLSTDLAHSYKPDARAYKLGISALKLPKEDILFVAFAGWDAAGAKTFGYPTFWVNRLGLPTEELGVRPDGIGATLNDLLSYIG